MAFKPIPIQLILIALPQNPNVVATLLIPLIPQTPSPFIELNPSYVVSPFSDNIDHNHFRLPNWWTNQNWWSLDQFKGGTLEGNFGVWICFIIQKLKFRLETLPPSQSIVSCKWILNRKHHHDGTISWYKA